MAIWQRRALTFHGERQSCCADNFPVRELCVGEIAAQFQLKWIYDAFYVALAEIVGCDLWTADEALHDAVREAHPNVRLLADYRLA